MGYRELVIADGAIAYWRLDENSGTTAVDAIAGAVGTVSGGVTRGRPGPLSDGNTAMAFDGVTGMVACPALAIPAAYTVEAWVKSTAGSGVYYPIVCNRLGSTDTGMFLFGILNSKLIIYQQDSPADQVGSARAINDGAWHHVVCAATGAQVALYIDGALDTTGPLLHAARTNPVTIAQDANGGPSYLAATIDEVAIYPTALSAAQIAAHFAAATAPLTSYSPLHRTGCARLGIGRLKAFRLNVYEAWLAATVNGVNPATGPGTGLMIRSAAVQHALNEQVDTGSFTARGFLPVAGQTINVVVGDKTDPNHLLLGGRILETTVRYEQKAEEVQTDIRCVDPTWLMQRRLVLATYVNQSATAIVLDLIARFTRNITTRNVQAGLPTIDAITFTNEQVPACLTAICQRIGAYWFPDYGGDLHLFTVADTPANPITAAQPHGSRKHAKTEDLSQVVTRVIGRGGGVAAAIDLPAGEVELPLDEGDLTQSWYAPSGGLVEVNTQRVQYSGVRGVGATGSVVGTGNAPSSPPAPTPVSGASHTVGATYGYAVAFVTATGETLPGPVGAIRISPFASVAPPAVSARSRGPGQYPAGMISPGANAFNFAVQIFYRGGAVGPLGAASPVYGWDGNDWEVYIGPRSYYTAPDGSAAFYYPTLEPGGPAAPTDHVLIYRMDNAGGFGWMQVSSDYYTSYPGWYQQCASSYSTAPVIAASGYGSVNVAALPISKASGVTGRRIYRTAANGSALKLLTTVANNTATVYGPDTITDAALGVAPPVLDTSGIRDEGQVLLGATSMVVSSTAPFAADATTPTGGGWARLGGIVIRYGSIGAGVLAGIPASGVGAITATVRYGTQVLVQPRLVGIPPSGTGALLLPVRKGDTVTIRLEQDDAAAQAVMAERLKLPGQAAVAADGIIETVVSDGRWGLTELAAQIAATLLERKDPHVTLRFESRDPSLEVGRLVTVTLTTPPIAGTFRIQRVTFTEIAITGASGTLLPLRAIEATNKLYTFADLLRRLRGREGGIP